MAFQKGERKQKRNWILNPSVATWEDPSQQMDGAYRVVATPEEGLGQGKGSSLKRSSTGFRVFIPRKEEMPHIHRRITVLIFTIFEGCWTEF